MNVRCAANCLPLLIQQHNVYATDFFNRSWAEYKVGFNDTRGNYWLGNDLLSELTNNRYRLRFELHAVNGTWYWAEYSSFVVRSEADNYRLLVSGYSGNAGDALSDQNNKMFTTYDRDNDDFRHHCAVYNGGGFWYKYCSWCSVTAIRGRGESFRWYTPQTGNLLLQISRMWLMC